MWQVHVFQTNALYDPSGGIITSWAWKYRETGTEPTRLMCWTTYVTVIRTWDQTVRLHRCQKNILAVWSCFRFIITKTCLTVNPKTSKWTKHKNVFESHGVHQSLLLDSTSNFTSELTCQTSALGAAVLLFKVKLFLPAVCLSGKNVTFEMLWETLLLHEQEHKQCES